MFNLEPREKKIIIVLSAFLLLGLGISAYKKSHSHMDVRIGSFTAEKENYHRLININTADLNELASLEGIGKVLAERIVEYRSQKGQFSSIESIKNVKGVGQSLFDKIRDDITVE